MVCIGYLQATRLDTNICPSPHLTQAAKNIIISREEIVKYISADMAELADAPGLGPGGKPCRFESCYPHFISQTI